jgi:c-di-GMP-related signal transduction protein
MKAFGDNLFSSVRELSWLTCLSRSNVHRHLTKSLGLTVRLLRWVPHRLTDDQKTIRRRSEDDQKTIRRRSEDDQKTIRVNLSRELLQVIQTQQARGWHDIVSLDESWFYFSMDHERIWLAPG